MPKTSFVTAEISEIIRTPAVSRSHGPRWLWVNIKIARKKWEIDVNWMIMDFIPRTVAFHRFWTVSHKSDRRPYSLGLSTNITAPFSSGLRFLGTVCRFEQASGSRDRREPPLAEPLASKDQTNHTHVDLIYIYIWHVNYIITMYVYIHMYIHIYMYWYVCIYVWCECVWEYTGISWHSCRRKWLHISCVPNDLAIKAFNTVSATCRQWQIMICIYLYMV